MLQLLCQYRLSHLQVRLLQAKKNLPFHQRPPKVGELFRPRIGDVRLGEEVSLDGIGTGVTSVTFRMHLPMCMRKGHQPFHTTMAPSRLSSSLSRARSCPYSSTVTVCEGDEALHQSTSKIRCHNKEASPGKRLHRVKTHLADDDARLEEVSVPAR
jgi:hypothetical protein